MNRFSLIETKRGWFINSYTVRDNESGLITQFKGTKGTEKRLLESSDLYMSIFLVLRGNRGEKVVWR